MIASTAEHLHDELLALIARLASRPIALAHRRTYQSAEELRQAVIFDREHAERFCDAVEALGFDATGLREQYARTYAHWMQMADEIAVALRRDNVTH